MAVTMLVLGTLALWSTLTVDDWLDGRASYYADGVMEQVLRNRGIPLPAGTIPVALNRKGDMHRRVWLEWEDGTVQAGYVIDCSQRQHYGERERARLVAEVDAQTARLRGFYADGPVPVRVHFVKPMVAERVPA